MNGSRIPIANMDMQPRPVVRVDAAYRLECEARHWLREGNTSAEAVNALLDRIRPRRGAAATEALRQEMRRQWARRAEWMTASL